MRHLKTKLVAPCDEQSTSIFMVILPQDQIPDSLGRNIISYYPHVVAQRFIFALSSYWLIKN